MLCQCGISTQKEKDCISIEHILSKMQLFPMCWKLHLWRICLIKVSIVKLKPVWLRPLDRTRNKNTHLSLEYTNTDSASHILSNVCILGSIKKQSSVWLCKLVIFLRHSQLSSQSNPPSLFRSLSTVVKQCVRNE